MSNWCQQNFAEKWCAAVTSFIIGVFLPHTVLSENETHSPTLLQLFPEDRRGRRLHGTIDAVQNLFEGPLILVRLELEQLQKAIRKRALPRQPNRKHDLLLIFSQQFDDGTGFLFQRNAPHALLPIDELRHILCVHGRRFSCELKTIRTPVPRGEKRLVDERVVRFALEIPAPAIAWIRRPPAHTLARRHVAGAFLGRHAIARRPRQLLVEPPNVEFTATTTLLMRQAQDRLVVPPQNAKTEVGFRFRHLLRRALHVLRGIRLRCPSPAARRLGLVFHYIRHLLPIPLVVLGAIDDGRIAKWTALRLRRRCAAADAEAVKAVAIREDPTPKEVVDICTKTTPGKQRIELRKLHGGRFVVQEVIVAGLEKHPDAAVGGLVVRVREVVGLHVRRVVLVEWDNMQLHLLLNRGVCRMKIVASIGRSRKDLPLRDAAYRFAHAPNIRSEQEQRFSGMRMACLSDTKVLQRWISYKLIILRQTHTLRPSAPASPPLCP